jgi:hypothetical protein
LSKRVEYKPLTCGNVNPWGSHTEEKSNEKDGDTP